MGVGSAEDLTVGSAGRGATAPSPAPMVRQGGAGAQASLLTEHALLQALAGLALLQASPCALHPGLWVSLLAVRLARSWLFTMHIWDVNCWCV